METIGLRALMITGVAPIAWGTTYLVTSQFLPPDRPLFSAAVRSLPIGIALLLWTRKLPRGEWWWKSAVLGITNIGIFLPLLFLAAYQLPGGVASTVQALSPLCVMTLAWPILGERAGVTRVVAGFVGLAGVALLVAGSMGAVTPIGLVGAVGSVVVSALGFVLIKRWPPEVDLFTLVSWQLLWGGLLLVPLAWVVEGPPPTLDAPAVGGYLWIGVVGTAIAYRCWFSGLVQLPAGAVALVGLLNPVVGTGLGVVFLGEPFGPVQAVGMAIILAGVIGGQRFTRRRLVRVTPCPAVASSVSAEPARTPSQLKPSVMASRQCRPSWG